MLKLNQLVFDEVVQVDTVSVKYYSKVDFNDPLGRYDKLAIQIVSDGVSTTGEDPTLFGAIETSCDGIHWVAKQSDFQIQLSSTTPTAAWFADDGSLPNYGLVRIRISLREGTKASAHVRVYVTARDVGRATRKAADPSRYIPLWNPKMHHADEYGEIELRGGTHYVSAL